MLPVPLRQRAALAALALAASLGLGACGTPLPWHAAPPATARADDSAPGRWQAPLPHGGESAALSRWWTQFDDALVPRLVQAAQAAHPGVASAAARVQQARANATAAGAALLPRVDGQAGASRALGTPDTPITGTTSAGATLAWELDLFGAAAAGRDAARAQLRAAQAGWHDARVLVAAEVAQQYLGLRACEAQLALAEADARSRAETERLTGLLAAAGLQSPANAALARASAAQARSGASARRAACDSQLKLLVELTAWDESTLREALQPGRGRVPAPPPLPLAGLPAQLLAQRPDVGRAADQLQAAAAALAQARAQRLPQVSISGTLGRARVSAGPVTQQGEVWSFGPLQVALPLFDGGRLAAAQDSAQAAYQEAEALLKARLRTAVREVEEALVALDGARQRAEDLRSAAQGYQQALRGTEVRHAGGLASLFELEDARRSAVQADAAWIDWQREQAAAWVALYRALGGGWTAESTGP